jgi:hypothetical protein
MRRRCLSLTGATVVVYDRLVRPRMQQWGPTNDERAATLPGDDIIQDVTSHESYNHRRLARSGVAMARAESVTDAPASTATTGSNFSYSP